MSGLTAKRKNVFAFKRTPNKSEQRKRIWTERIAPLRKYVSKLSKGQIRRNLNTSGIYDYTNSN